MDDPWVLRTISVGHRWGFLKQPGDMFQPTRLPGSALKKQVFLDYVRMLLDQGAVVPVPQVERFTGVYSPLFLVRKKTGGFRPVVDLKRLNVFIRKEHFKMESLQSILLAIRLLDWMITVDLRDAYFHVPVHPEFQRFLRFTLGEQHFQFVCLPFGLTTSPRIFSKLLLAVVAVLRTRGLRVYHYLDDILILADSRALLLQHRELALAVLEDFGWLVNREKSQLEPTQRIIYLGASIDSVQATVALPHAKVEKITRLFASLLDRVFLPAKTCMHLLGTMVSTFAMVSWAQWHSRRFQQEFLRQWVPEASSQKIRLTDEMRADMSWWADPRNLRCRISLARPVWVVIESDASTWGWGAVCQNQVAQGQWQVPSRHLVSNVLELRAAFQALLAFKDVIVGKAVLLKLDNVSAVAFIRRQGGARSRSLLREVTPIMVWAQKYLRRLSAVYTPGLLNRRADFLSRHSIDNNEWSLHPRVFQQVIRWSFRPEVDLFASRYNAKIRRFFSRNPCRLAMGVDALSAHWAFRTAYAFPPIPLIFRFLSRLLHEKVRIVAILPDWPRRPWYPLLMQLKIGEPLPLPVVPDLLRQGPISHPDPGRLHLMAWLLRGGG